MAATQLMCRVPGERMDHNGDGFITVCRQVGDIIINKSVEKKMFKTLWVKFKLIRQQQPSGVEGN